MTGIALGARFVLAAAGLALAAVAGRANGGAARATGDAPALSLRATVIGVAPDAPVRGEGAPGVMLLTITLFRWPTEAESTPLVTALSAPARAPALPAPPAGGRAGRGARGRQSAPPPPPGPLARLTTALKAAPTLGFIWGDGVTGYSIKYAWHSSPADGTERIVLVTDRRVGAHAADWAPLPGAAADADFTLIEMRIDGKGVGEGKATLGANVVVDASARTLALDGYTAAPALLKVTR